jgi:hypothetical protein
VQLWVVWYRRLIGDTEGPALITDTACTATYCRFPSWHTDIYSDAWGSSVRVDSVKQEVRFTDKHLGRSAEVIAGG